MHIFVLTPGYSRRAWAEGYEHERLESLLAAHENGFAHVGGCHAEVLYEMRIVIQGEDGGHARSDVFSILALVCIAARIRAPLRG